MGGCLSGPVEQDHQSVGHHASFAATDADDAAAALLESRSLGTRIQLFLRCEGLANMDAGHNDKSDPFVVVLIRDPATGQLRELGRTEVVVNSLQPTFIRTVPLTYKFEEVQRLVFRVYDCDSFGGAGGAHFDNSASHKIDWPSRTLSVRRRATWPPSWAATASARRWRSRTGRWAAGGP